MNTTFEQDLHAAVSYHGHLCSGQILGVRLARLALSRLGVEDPRTNPNLIVFVECDRCLADAVQSVTGCTLGRRRVKFLDYGKMAATVWDTASDKAVRVYSKGEEHAPKGADPFEFFRSIPDERLFCVQDVRVALPPEELPGPPASRVICDGCGEEVLDCREVQVQGKRLCAACAAGSYCIPL